MMKLRMRWLVCLAASMVAVVSCNDVTAPVPAGKAMKIPAPNMTLVTTAVPQVGTGWAHTCVLKSDGVVVCWGYNANGQTAIPSGIAGATAMAVGGFHNCVLKSDGTVSCWGDNTDGQTNIPSGLSGVTAISAGSYHNCVVKSDGTVRCWGQNYEGQSNVPAGLSGVTAVSAGGFHNCALKTDGTVLCWGNNDFGEQATPPPGLSGVTAIDAGDFHTCAVKSDASVVCWGFNRDGPTTIPAGLSGVTAVSAGGFHTCAVKSDGTVDCWGFNEHGRATVPLGLSGVTQVSAGRSHTCALKTDGSVVCWGRDFEGQTTVPFGLNLLVNGITAQTISFTSTPPAAALVGGSYAIAATGGASGNPVTFSSLSTDICTVSGSVVSLLSIGTCSVAANQSGSETFGAAPEASQSFSVVAASTSTVVTLSQATQQYSDNVTFTAAIVPSTPGGSSPAGSVQFKLDGNSIGSPQAVSSGTAELSVYAVGLASGSHTVAAVFTSTDSNFNGSTSGDVALIVTKEDANVAAGTSNPAAVQVSSAGGTASSVSLVFAVREKTPDLAALTATPGDIANATIAVSLIPVGAGGPISLTCNSGSVSGSGYSGVKSFTCSGSNLPVNTYEVSASVTGNYYTGRYSDALTIYDPSLGFVTGGGSFAWPGSGLRTTFGFTVKYLKNGTNVQGSALVVRHEPGGTVTRMKSNSMSGLALGEDSSMPMGFASFSGKSTYFEPGMETAVGNQNFTIYVEDRNNPGAGTDRVWIGGPMSLAMTGPATTNAQSLTGGAIAVAHKAP